MTLDFGAYLLFQASPGETDREGYDRGLIEAQYMDALGFDTVWVGNTPFAGDGESAYAFSIPPFMAATALAQLTRRINIGISISYLPLFHPVETARFAGALDYVSQGRLRLGVGRGPGVAYGDSGFKKDANSSGVAWQFTPGDLRKLFLEAVDLLKGLLEDEYFSYEGEHFQVSEMRSVPRPFQPTIPLFSTAQSAATFREMGVRGVNLLIPLPGFHGGPATWEETAALLETYRQHWSDAGHRGTPQVIVRFPMFLEESDDAAYNYAKRVLSTQKERQRAVLGQRGGYMRAMGIDANDPKAMSEGRAKVAKADASQTRALGWATVDEEIEKGTITGGPSKVADQMRRLEEELGATGVMLEHQYWTTTRDEQMRSLRMAADLVKPRLS